MNQTISKIVFGFSLISSLTACGGKNNPTVEAISANEATTTPAEDIQLPQAIGHESKIIGVSTLVKVRADGANVESNLRAKLDAFGAVAISETASNGGAGTCTGTHIGNGYVITAGHCFFNESAPGDLSETGAACPEIKVYWGYRGSPDTGSPKPIVTLVSQCTQVIYAERSANRDFGIFKVDHAPKTSVSISVDTKRTADNTKVTLFGYPQARPLEWSQYCPLKKSIGAAGTGTISTDQFAYQCDTEPGNSGSTVLAVSATGSVKVVGIHDGAGPDTVDYNYATYMFDIRKQMKAKGFDLDHLTGSI
jgi:V8-like Glu-specific endopeptidase